MTVMGFMTATQVEHMNKRDAEKTAHRENREALVEQYGHDPEMVMFMTMEEVKDAIQYEFERFLEDAWQCSLEREC